MLWEQRLGVSRKGRSWLNVFKTLVCYRLIDPGIEWRPHRQWFEHSAMGDFLGEGFPLAHEVMPGNTADNNTLADFLKKIEDQYGRSERVWVTDRGIPTEGVLAQMRESSTPIH